MIGFTVRAKRREMSTLNDRLIMDTGDLGFVRSFDRPRNRVIICNMSKARSDMNVPLFSVEIGFKRGKMHLNYTPPGQLIPNQAFRALSLSNQGHIINRTLTGIFSGIHDKKDLLSISIRRYDNFVRNSNGQSSDAIAHGFFKGICDAWTSGKPSYPVKTLVDNCPDATKSEGSGVYLRVYMDFDKKSKYHGSVWLYTGKTRNFKARAATHIKSSKKGAQMNTQHYAVMQAAKTVRYIKIWESNSRTQLPGTDDELRSVVEMLVTLLLNTMHSSTIKLEIRSDDPSAAPTEAVLNSSFRVYTNAQVATVWTQIANEVMGETGLPRLSSPN